MTVRSRVVLAHVLLVSAGLVVALATAWYFAGTGRQVTPAAARAVAPKATPDGARLAADAFVGAVKAADPHGICTLLSDELRHAHPNCTQWARSFIGMTAEGSYSVLAVVMQQRDQARVRMLIDGDHYFWFFRHEPDGWRFERVAEVPKA